MNKDTSKHPQVGENYQADPKETATEMKLEK
jgi:hypothetical protein